MERRTRERKETPEKGGRAETHTRTSSQERAKEIEGPILGRKQSTKGFFCCLALSRCCVVLCAGKKVFSAYTNTRVCLCLCVCVCIAVSVCASFPRSFFSVFRVCVDDRHHRRRRHTTVRDSVGRSSSSRVRLFRSGWWKLRCFRQNAAKKNIECVVGVAPLPSLTAAVSCARGVEKPHSEQEKEKCPVRKWFPSCVCVCWCLVALSKRADPFTNKAGGCAARVAH